MGMVTDPQTGPLHLRVREMLDNGNLVCLGQDDISDAYYPYGRNNMLEVGFLASHLLWFTTASDMEILYDMITTNAGQVHQCARLRSGSRKDRPTWWFSISPMCWKLSASTKRLRT